MRNKQSIPTYLCYIMCNFFLKNCFKYNFYDLIMHIITVLSVDILLTTFSPHLLNKDNSYQEFKQFNQYI